jgi:hypothetical protein
VLALAPLLGPFPVAPFTVPVTPLTTGSTGVCVGGRLGTGGTLGVGTFTCGV